MVFKPNYNFQKAERDRAKQAKKDAKLREKDEAKRRAAAGEPELPETGADAESDVDAEAHPNDAA